MEFGGHPALRFRVGNPSVDVPTSGARNYGTRWDITPTPQGYIGDSAFQFTLSNDDVATWFSYPLLNRVGWVAKTSLFTQGGPPRPRSGKASHRQKTTLTAHVQRGMTISHLLLPIE